MIIEKARPINIPLNDSRNEQQTIVGEHFVFWQQYKESDEAQRYMTFYKVHFYIPLYWKHDVATRISVPAFHGTFCRPGDAASIDADEFELICPCHSLAEILSQAFYYF